MCQRFLVTHSEEPFYTPFQKETSHEDFERICNLIVYMCSNHSKYRQGVDLMSKETE